MSARHHSPYNKQNISLKLIRHFVVICNSTSLSNAAHQLNVCQSNLSLQMNELEEKLGVKLMDRSWRGVELTQAGQYFLGESIAMLQRFEKTREALQRIALGSMSSVVCGTFSSLDYAVVPQAIKKLRASADGMEVKVVEMSTSSLPKALDSGQIHVAVMLGRLPTLPFHTETLQTTALQLIAPTDHRLARSRRPISAGAFDGEVFWLVERDVEPALHRKTVEFLDSYSVPRGKVRQASSLKEMIAQVSSGGGLALVPACLELDRGSDVVQKGLGDASPSLEIVLCHKGTKASSSSQVVAHCLVEATRTKQAA